MSETTETKQRDPRDYTTWPRQFPKYKWYKPLLVGLLGFVFMLLIQIVITLVGSIWTGGGFLDLVSESYDEMNVYTGPGALAELGGLAAILTAIALAALVVRDRPFSSYSSSRGGWDWKLFLKCLGIAILVMGAFTVVQCLAFPEDADGINQFTLDGIIACLILIPLQCLAEEYLFRGYLMQTIGAWTRLPILAFIVQAALFAAGHPYNAIGVAVIFINGLLWGFMAWKTRGLEATSALHIVNNMVAFFMAGLGLSVSTSQIDIPYAVIDVVMMVVYAAIILLVGKKHGWFEVDENEPLPNQVASMRVMPMAYPGQQSYPPTSMPYQAGQPQQPWTGYQQQKPMPQQGFAPMHNQHQPNPGLTHQQEQKMPPEQ